jgi:FecR protein
MLSRLAGALVVLSVHCALAQSGPVVARAASVSGPSVLSNTSGAVGLTPGYILSPGDRIDTRGGGRVVIDLSDGSMVVVQPESVIVLKDYREAGSLRELFEITVGMVRVKINHFAGKPNPYRMNSPTASIAVRGTEFSIQVDQQGQTQVVVYEGAVEVSSLSDPDRRTLVEAGRGVLVSGQDFHIFFTAPNRPGGGDGDGDRHPPVAAAPPGGNPQPGAPPAPAPQHPDSAHDKDGDNSPRANASAYDRYVAGLADLSQAPFLYRFNAFPEAHLDSLENPAAASQFTTGEGRFFFLPTFSGVRELQESQEALGPGGTLPGDYSISPQFSMFTPVGGGYTVGGAVAVSRVGNTSLGDASTPGSSSSATFFSGALVAAKRVGADSFGIELDTLRGTGSLTSGPSDTASSITQDRLTAGYTRDLGNGATLGLFYRYAFIRAGDSSTLSAAATAGHSSEAGLRLRGALSRRLQYGVAAVWTGVSLRQQFSSATLPAPWQPFGQQRTTLALGLGYALSRRTMLSFDVAGGVAQHPAGRFGSVHLAMQTDVTRKLFASASYLNLWQRQGMMLYPGTYPIGSHFSDYGAGWRFSRDLFVQYLFSTDYGFSTPSHTVMLRYTFRLRGE